MTRKILTVAVCTLLINGALTALEPDDSYDLFEKKEYTKNDHTLRYRILWPDSMKAGEKYPLFIFLHGMGLGGRDNEKQLKRGADIFLKPENRAKYPSIVVYPQAPFLKSFVSIAKNKGFLQLNGLRKLYKKKDQTHTQMDFSAYGDMVYEVIGQLIEKGIVDTERIYIGGTSMGAFTAFQFISEYPNLFAAAVSIAGGADPATIENWAGKVPVWIVHGDKDPVIPVESSRHIVEELEQRGIRNYRYSEYPGVKHHSWDNAFEEQDYLEWFFSKRKYHPLNGSLTSN